MNLALDSNRPKFGRFFSHEKQSHAFAEITDVLFRTTYRYNLKIEQETKPDMTATQKTDWTDAFIIVQSTIVHPEIRGISDLCFSVWLIVN